MTTVQTPADRLSSAAALSGISSKLQKNLFFLVLVILGNSVATLMLIGGTYDMATEDRFTGARLYFGWPVPASERDLQDRARSRVRRPAGGFDGEAEALAGFEAGREHRSGHAVAGHRQHGGGPVSAGPHQPQLVAAG